MSVAPASSELRDLYQKDYQLEKGALPRQIISNGPSTVRYLNDQAGSATDRPWLASRPRLIEYRSVNVEDAGDSSVLYEDDLERVVERGSLDMAGPPPPGHVRLPPVQFPHTQNVSELHQKLA